MFEGEGGCLGVVGCYAGWGRGNVLVVVEVKLKRRSRRHTSQGNELLNLEGGSGGHAGMPSLWGEGRSLFLSEMMGGHFWLGR